MLFRYRHSSTKEEGWNKGVSNTHKVFAASELKKHRVGLCSAIISLALFFTIVVNALNQVYQDSKQENVTPLVLHANQEKLAVTKEVQGLEVSKESKSLVLLKEEEIYIQDIVLLPEEVLVLVHFPSADSATFGHPSKILCIHSDEIVTKVNGVEHLQGRVAVRCELPKQEEQQPLKDHVTKLSFLSLMDTDLNRHVRQRNQASNGNIISWDFLVYESLSTSADVVLFAKGVNQRKEVNAEPESLLCVFNGTVETLVKVSSQEVFRCMHPHKSYRDELVGTKVSLKWHGQLIPSVAYYQLPKTRLSRGNEPRHHQEVLCSCTMVFNVAKFLKEWIMYHSYLGVEHFFLYDNNSEDNLVEIVGSLAGEFNVTRHPWPWIKTQEAGFSHCALQAKNKCQWMLFSDVDEFVFSPKWPHHLQEGNRSRKQANETRSTIKSSQMGEKALKSLVMERSHNPEKHNSGSGIQIGQISIKCNNFGPSGLKIHPEKGVTQGYTCREKAQQRHKSIVLLEALPPSLVNVIHHFQLKRGYKSEYLKPSKTVINHYKYQAWSEFKSKFRRRVSAYVVDWKELKNADSKDRTPGLGNHAIEPPQWEKRFCEVNDTALRDFTLRVFSSGSRMQWQL
ncbi:hypothetical protein SUGI_0377970 [Cryptomeria japonica]|uniref:glycosyltransferase family 92 protein RCOM_0530710 n=1 Tax=Cryptomeria japonica TaxID=3369 RepID=UPI002408C90D|nr:glycosyltransferase family 92 protein RCOM_0530710 [Cryptomeria japonica]GLJ20741.1 hypothetical protein SUGI_0377970 [Cryptomeria japonica]